MYTANVFVLFKENEKLKKVAPSVIFIYDDIFIVERLRLCGRNSTWVQISIPAIVFRIFLQKLYITIQT